MKILKEIDKSDLVWVTECMPWHQECTLNFPIWINEVVRRTDVYPMAADYFFQDVRVSAGIDLDFSMHQAASLVNLTVKEILKQRSVIYGH